MFAKGRRLYGALFAVGLLAGCGGGGGTGHPEQRTHVAVVVPEMKMKVGNSLASHAVSLVSRIKLDASGILKQGSYSLGKHVLAIPHDTPFALKASVPMTGSNTPDLSLGDGTFSLDGPVTVDGIAMPKQVTLKNHTASADIDVVGTLVSAVVSRLPKPDDMAVEASSANLSTGLSNLSVAEAQLDLRTDAPANIAGCRFTFAPNSRLLFSNVRFTDKQNFTGDCKLAVGAKDVRATVANGDLKLGEVTFVCDARALNTNGSLAISLKDKAGALLNVSQGEVIRGNKTLLIQKASLAPALFTLLVKAQDWKNASLKIAGNLKTSATATGGAFGIPQFNATVGSLGLEMDAAKKRVTFDDCRVVLNSADVNQAVIAHLPKSKTVRLDKELIHQTPWRYKAVTAASLEVTNLHVAGLRLSSQNSASLSCSADAHVRGTVEKEHPLGALLRRNGDTPDTKPWSATGTLGGPATVKFAVIPGRTFADSKARAVVGLTLNKLDNARVDWTAVSSSIAGKAEGTIISALVGALKKHITAKGIPLETTVTTPLFNHPDSRLEMLTVKSLAVRPIAGGTEVVASGYIDLN